MLNPLAYTERIVSDFLRYQLTAYPFSDRDFYEQMRELLNLEETRNTPLLKGPYISLSQSFRQGAAVSRLVAEKVLHPHLTAIARFPVLYGHQETAIRHITAGRTTLVSTGTASGKTECFLYPIISKCLNLRDAREPEGISAVIVYPMNALAEDQLERLRGLLAGSGITYGMYVGTTPEREADVTGHRLPDGASRADYEVADRRRQAERQPFAIIPPEERASREAMREVGKQPRILITNIKQLELLLTRQRDVELFEGARLDFIVFDEAHTFKGAVGAETACLIRRLRAFCGRTPAETTCVAASATIADPERGPDAGRDFASRFFGVPREQVALVGEEYQPDQWAAERVAPVALPGDPAAYLQDVLEAVESGDSTAARVTAVYGTITGRTLEASNWEERLYDDLVRNEVVFQIAATLGRPQALTDLLSELQRRVGRVVPEEEVLLWLTLGVAARKDKRPLLRPVVHGFIRGMGGAVVTFPENRDRPRLWLSAEDAALGAGEDGLFALPVMTCRTCGQHYFAQRLENFRFTAGEPEGGAAVEDRIVWRSLQTTDGATRVILTDRIISNEGDDGDGGNPQNTAPVFLCRHCGALHPALREHCDGCGRQGVLVALLAVRQRDDAVGQLARCLSCGTVGRQMPGRFLEPARPVKAIAVSDVHVLAQNMIQHAHRKRLLVFADNRQDAAFQAGWMQDHARRFRLRSLMYQRLRVGPISIGDLTAHLEQVLEANDDLSRALIPEVWQQYRKQEAQVHHIQERQRFLRIQILRELTTGLKQTKGLEPWGRLSVEYQGLTPDLPFFQNWAAAADTNPELLLDGVASLLDVTRRRSAVLFDRDGRIFSRFMSEGDLEILRGYLPLRPDVPKGLKLSRAPTDDKNRVDQWLSGGALTLARQSARNWGLRAEDMDDFFTALWNLLTEELQILVPVTLVGQRGNALPRCAGVRQIDADKLSLHPARGGYRCRTCQRIHNRLTPNMACMAWHCHGTIQYEDENPDDYDLMVLDQDFSMIRPREHSAQVPPEERAMLERVFKGSGELLNTLVCTPTLELGVNIGLLDAVLMRNVPPLPANYWQRAGRAGREHRMAVNVTYARPASHDQAYFRDPLKLLRGSITPPRFNLRNAVMVEKHVHAVVLTTLHQMARPASGVSETDRAEVAEVLAQCFPTHVAGYLFENGALRAQQQDVTRMTTLVTKHEAHLIHRVQEVFSQVWPAEDADVVTEALLRDQVRQTGNRLAQVIQRVWRRLQWALDQMRRLEEVRRLKGTLASDEDALYDRCDRLVKKLKGQQRRQRSTAEGYDDTNTMGMLAFEGFLPGYGLDIGSILAVAQMPKYSMGGRDMALPRAPALALREFPPGNLIYANGHKFVPRYYHLEADPPLMFQVDVQNEAVQEVGTVDATTAGGLGTVGLQAIPICDVDLPHHAYINDEEDYRFQLGVSVLGHEKGRHGGGMAYRWGEKQLSFRRGVHLRLVNVGVTHRLRGDNELGFPVCLVCGQSRSPLASQADLDQFVQSHEDRCGRHVGRVGFFTDVVADALTIDDMADRTEAYSTTEALRMGAAEILDMEVDDLQILVIGRPGRQEVDAMLYDPMPGGSGLIEQMMSRWGEVVAAAQGFVANCESRCETACVDCLLTFRNAFYHRHLNRHTAATRLEFWGPTVEEQHAVPPRMPVTEPPPHERPVDEAESRLRDILQRADFPAPEGQKTLSLGHPLGSTTPDFFYADPDVPDGGICVYLDGMSGHLHGRPETRATDRRIREELRSRHFEVFEIAYGDLFDREVMRRVLSRLARLILGRDAATTIRNREDWFPEEQGESSVTQIQVALRRVADPPESERFKTLVPLYSLKVAAGAFGEAQPVEPECWVELPPGRKLRNGMFAARVVGHSMEPLIPDGSFCLFHSPVTGSRDGRTVLVQHRDIADPESGGSYTVKRYQSEKVESDDGGWRHARVTLLPINAQYQPIVLENIEEGELTVSAEFLEVLPPLQGYCT